MTATKEDLRVIVGLGKTGFACARYLISQGIAVAVTDTRQTPPYLKQLHEEFPQIKVSLGTLDKELLLSAKEIIISPGVSLHDPVIEMCIAKGIPVFGDIEIFAEKTKAPICAVTGSNAKSTVTMLLVEMARTAEFHMLYGGNIGIPVLDLLSAVDPDLYILELSSFQLETTESFRATASTILNISPDHMDRYKTLDDYIEAKQRIYRGSQFIIWNRDDPLTYPKYAFDGASLISFGLNTPKLNEFGLVESPVGSYLALGDEKLITVDELGIKGRHNWANALAALAVGYAMKFPMPAMLQALRSFSGLRHRCQWIAKSNGVNWYNDSKGTNVGASIAAITGLGSSISGKVILIAGGQGKGADFSDLVQPIANHVRQVILIGEDADKIAQAIQKVMSIEIAKTMEEAVLFAHRAALSGDAVLLSPACASFDMFKNYEHRGDVFINAVEELLR